MSNAEQITKTLYKLAGAAWASYHAGGRVQAHLSFIADEASAIRSRILLEANYAGALELIEYAKAMGVRSPSLERDPR